MKFRTLMMSAIILTCLGFGMNTSAQRYTDSTPGLLISGSCGVASLPKAAQEFINRHFANVAIKKCMHVYAEATYKVKLANGVELEFGNDGKIVEIEAAKNKCLSEAIVKDVVPSKTYKYLKDNNVINYVESIEYSRGRVVSVELDIKGPDTMIFDLDGTFLVIED